MRSIRVTRRLNKYSTWNRKKTTLFYDHYIRNRSTLDIGVLGYIGIVQHKEHSPEVWHIPPGTPCVYIRYGACGGEVVKALRYTSTGRWFDSRWCHWNFSGRTMVLESIDSAS